MSKDGRSCMLNSSPQSKTGLTIADPSENSEIIHKIASPQDLHDFTIGKRVYVGGTRPGVIAYIGETHFAPGDWVGVVLDDPSGKNDGCVAGKRYFQCDPKRGVFSRLNRLSLTPINDSKRNSASELDFDMERSRTTLSNTARRDPVVGDRVIVSSGLGSRLGELKFLGETEFAAGTWCGIQLDEPNGKNDGTVEGVKYFECPPKYGIFVPIAKVSLSPLSKKGNMSRMGSRESLTSVGTINSVATTNTSRLRMSMLKRPSQNIILPPTPNKNLSKPTFSMQDIIREKQNYIEQLMTERELDREDVQNQNMRHQKEIDEMKEKISVLEIKLDKTKKKNEELKNAIDEATFCGDELNAQNQVFREKIIVLEKKLIEFDPNSAAAIDQKLAEIEKIECKKCTDYCKETVRLKNELEKLLEELEKLKIEMKNTGSSGKLEIELIEKNTKISDLETGISQLESDKEFLEIEFKKLKEESNEIMKIISQKDIETNHYQTKLEKLDIQNSDLNSQIEKSTKMNINLESEILQLKSKLNSLHTDLELALKSKDLEKMELGKLNVVNTEIVTQKIKELEENNLKNLELEKNLAQLKTDNDKLKVEIEMIKDNTTKIQHIHDNETKESSEKLKLLVSQNDVLNKRIQEIEFKNENLIIEAEKYVAEINTQKQQLDNQNRDNKKYSELEIVLKTIENDLTKKESEIVENRAKKDEMEKKYSDIENQKQLLEIELQNLNRNLTEISNNKNNVESDLSEKIKNLEVQNVELIKKIEETEKINKNLAIDLEKSTTELNNQKFELNSIIENKNIEMKKFSELETLHKSLKIQINENENGLLVSNNKINELEKIIELLKIEKENSIKSLEKVKEDCIEIKNSMSEESIEYNKKLQDLETKNNEYQMKISEITKSKELLELDTQNMRKNYDAKEAELAASLSNRENEKKISDNLNKDLTEKELQLKEISRRTNDLEITLGQIKMDKESLENNFKKLTEDADNMKKLNREKIAESNELKFKSESLQNENIELNRKLKETIDINKNFELEIQRLSTQLNDLSSALNSKETENKELNQFTIAHKIIQEENVQKEIQLNDKNFKITELEQNIVQIKNEKDNLQNQLRKIQDNIIEMEKLKIEESNDFKSKLDAQNSAFQFKLIESAEANNRLVTEIKNLESKLSSTLASKQLESNELNILQEAHKVVQENIIQKDNQLKEKIQIISDLEIKVIQIKKIKEDLEREFHKLKDDLCKNQVSQTKELNQLRESLKLSEQSNNDLNNTILEKTESKSQELEEYKLKLSELRNQNIQLEEKIKGINYVNEQLTTNLKNQQLQYAELQQNIIQDETELSEKEIKISELEKIITEQRNNNVSLTNNLEELKKISNSATQESIELKLKLNELENHNKNFNENNKILQSDVEKLTNQLQIQNTEVETSTNKIEELITENFDLQIKCSETNDLLLKIKTDYEKLQSEYQNIQSISKSVTNKYEQELNIEKSELEKADKAVHEIRNELEKLQESNKNLNQENEQYKKTIGLMEQEKQDAVNNAEMLQIESEQVLDQITDNNNQYKKELENLKQELFLKDREILHSKNIIELTNKDLKDKMTSIMNLENEISKFKSPISVPIPQSMEKGDSNYSLEQINFLNSIIADMHKKNENLISRIEALESPASVNFLNSSSLEILNKRKPAPRLFCDICDEFDAHDTEDCPIQASDDSPPNSTLLTNPNKIKPLPRKYCESCEEFGHETEECPNGECF